MSLKSFFTLVALNKILNSGIKSYKNWIRLIDLIKIFAKNPGAQKILDIIKEEKYYKAFSRLNEINLNCRKKLVNNLIINFFIRDESYRKKYLDKHGIRPPSFLVISPTMRCNLRCIGCYAGEYTRENDLPEEVFDRILKEAKEMGIYFITISGGEPFINPWLMKMFKKHSNVFFQVYTNGTLIDKKLAGELAKLGNVAPAISVEGFEHETDKRRGKGIYSKVLEAMKNLREAKCIFGFSVTPTRINSDVISSDKFIDFYVKQGCMFGWFFTYIPIGLKPDVKLMQTPEQRCKLREKIRQWRREVKPIFIGDFWNDGQYVKGCIAGARQCPEKGAGYLHINCKGDVEPCVFIHFSVDNIKEKSLKEVLKSDFFTALREGYNEVKNWLMPCCIIDNPEILRNAVKKTGAKPTHPGAETIVTDKKIMKHLDNYSKKMHKLTDNLWNTEICPTCKGARPV